MEWTYCVTCQWTSDCVTRVAWWRYLHWIVAFPVRECNPATAFPGTCFVRAPRTPVTVDWFQSSFLYTLALYAPLWFEKKRNRKIYFSLYRLVVEVLISYFYEWSTSFVNKRLLRLNCKRNGTKVVARLEKDKYCSKSRNSFTKRAFTLQLFCNLVATGHCYWKQWGREVSVEVLFHKQPCFQGEKEKISAVVLVYLHLFSFTI